MISFDKFLKRYQFPKMAALLLLLVLLVVGAVPGYLTGNWQWKQPPSVASLKQLKQLRQTGLALPGWQTIEKREQVIGGHKWLLQIIKKQGEKTEAILLLQPQNGPKEQPEVEWTEINGWQRWQVAQYRSAEFSVKQPEVLTSNSPAKVRARFFRGYTEQQTFAILQWYAVPNGGYTAPISWFLADQVAQWRNSRVPWVAVSILIPMEPLGQVETTWPLAQSLGQTVQATLMGEAFRQKS